MKWLASVAVVAACGGGGAPAVVPPPASSPPGSVVLPTELVADRWYLVAPVARGGAVRLYLDSAGGMFVTEEAATRLGLARSMADDQAMAAFPTLADAGIPRPKTASLPVVREPFAGADGMLGAPWFAGHAFVFDYVKHQLSVVPALPAVEAEHRIAVHFAPDMPYGRIEMTVAGEKLDMLLDTGAEIALTESARAALGGGAVERATSFITQSVFERWHAAHPDWRVIDNADTHLAGSPMIEVPTLTVGGYDVGPVWFTRRPDGNFHTWMAQWMDKPVEGALGGDAYYGLRVGVDWTTGTATFAR